MCVFHDAFHEKNSLVCGIAVNLLLLEFKFSVGVGSWISQGTVKEVSQYLSKSNAADGKQSAEGDEKGRHRKVKEYKNELLSMACRFGNDEVCKYLLLNDADPNWTAMGGKTALHNAAFFRRLDLVDHLLTWDISVDVRDDLGLTPLFYAAFWNDANCVTRLTSHGARIDGVSPWQLTNAVFLNQIAAVKDGNVCKHPLNIFWELLRLDKLESFEFGEVDFWKNWIFRFSAGLGNNLPICTLLFRAGADPNRVQWVSTPLNYAAMNNNVDIVKYLIDEVGVSINAEDSLSRTALHCAAYFGQDDACRVLLDRGADPFYSTVDGNPLDIARRQGNHVISGIMETFFVSRLVCKKPFCSVSDI
eukprot:m.28711 g.28711  ORF g.28711 m.28711 type:complete len:361 (+) comp30977_c0_seq4:17-1099(+)